ncbi:ATPase [Mycobacterium sp. pW049]|uniref:ATPase n=1 Tax=[Mycobacterium] bulgaricum TaxID=3238985 RepID=UPI00351B0873
MTAEERYVATRTVAAPAADIFAVLADPSRHQDTEPTDWVRDAVTTDPLTEAGQVFVVNMFLEHLGGEYVMHNLVTVFEQDRSIGWLPGNVDAGGRHSAPGWWWRYDLAPTAAGTDVTLTYDWSATLQAVRDQLGGLPPFGREFLDESLASLARTVENGTP